MDFPRHLKGKKTSGPQDRRGKRDFIEIRANFHKYRAGADKFVLFVQRLWGG